MSDKVIIDVSRLLKVKRQADGWLAQCPACHENGADSQGSHLRIWSSTMAFSCAPNPGDRAHNHRILQLAGTGEVSQDVAPTPQSRVELPQSWPIDVLKGLVANYDYWAARGVSADTCQRFKVGVAIKAQMAGRSVIPIIDKRDTSKIIGFTGRALDKANKMRWKHLGEKASWVYPAVDAEIKRSNAILILESPADMLYLWDRGIRCTLDLFGVKMSSAVTSYILQMNPSRILVGTNNEMTSANGGVGNKAAELIISQLSQFFNRDRIMLALPSKKDFAEMTDDEIKAYKTQWTL